MLTVMDVSSRLHLPVSWQIHLKNKWMFISEDILTPTSICHFVELYSYYSCFVFGQYFSLFGHFVLLYPTLSQGFLVAIPFLPVTLTLYYFCIYWHHFLDISSVFQNKMDSAHRLFLSQSEMENYFKWIIKV